MTAFVLAPPFITLDEQLLISFLRRMSEEDSNSPFTKMRSSSSLPRKNKKFQLPIHFSRAGKIWDSISSLNLAKEENNRIPSLLSTYCN
jgi:hypothetical protein